MLSKLEGLSEYDIRRPLTPTGTNLLGLIKHLSIIEARCFGETFGRPFPEHVRWWVEDDDGNVGMWATEGESRAEVAMKPGCSADLSWQSVTCRPLQLPGRSMPLWYQQ
jgi:hypothetical protein